MKSISSFSRRIGIAFIYIAIAGSLIGGIIYMATVINLPEITLKSETLNTTTTSLTLLNNDSYVINFTVNDYDLPYTLLFSNSSNITAGHNLTVINASYSELQYYYTFIDGPLAGTYNLNPYVVNITTRHVDNTAGAGAYFYMNITTAKGTIIAFYCDADNGELGVYVNNTVLNYPVSGAPDWRINIVDNGTSILIYFEGTLYGVVNDHNITSVIIMNDQYIETSYMEYWYKQSVQKVQYNYYLDNDLVDSSTTLKNISYIYDDLYLDSTIIVENYTIRSIQSSEPITIYYHKETSVDMGIILDIIAVLFGILLIVKAAGYLGVRL